MNTTLVIAAIVLILVVLTLMFRVQSLLAISRESHARKGGINNNFNAVMFVVFLVVGCSAALIYTFCGNYSLPKSGSDHGLLTDRLLLQTMAVIGSVVIITHALLMGFAYTYRYKEDRKAKFFPDNHKLELIWTVIPAIVLTFLIFSGWKVWAEVMKKSTDKNVFRVEAVAQQFEWNFRYPGADGEFGKHNFRKINSLTPEVDGDCHVVDGSKVRSANSMGIDYSLPGNSAALDDFVSKELVLPKGREIEIRIRAKDVLHSLFLPHMRVKMDAVPGTPTFFKFTPYQSTIDKKNELAADPNWQKLVINGSDTSMRWENFEYEVACTEICGSGHYKMKRSMRVLEQDQYNKWEAEQIPWSIYDCKNREYVLNEIASSKVVKEEDKFKILLRDLDDKYKPQDEVEDNTGSEGTDIPSDSLPTLNVQDSVGNK